jgi:hypothetical protein
MITAKLRLVLGYAMFGILLAACAKNESMAGAAATSSGPVTWQFDNLQSIGGYALTVEGDPRVIETPNGKAIEFDGVDDGIFLDVHPLAGMDRFTVEVIFNPYAAGAAEQRFFHMQENASDQRVMFETRLVDGDRWFLDTFINSNEQKIPLYAQHYEHETGSWFHAAIVVDENSFTHYVNGHAELSEAIRYVPQGSGQTSLGVRINRVNWFKGAIRTVRFSPRVLAPDEFLSTETRKR